MTEPKAVEIMSDAPEIPNAPADRSPERAAWMRILALASTAELASSVRALGELPERHWLRKPETGMTMVQARSGGTGMRFNLGEMTVTRCAVNLRQNGDAVGGVGIAYVQGRSTGHAEYAAIADALLQSPEWHDRVVDAVLGPLEQARQARRAASAQAVAETRVDFFTMERGENPDA
jgi:alpha-D-ribose 1-methylphosphonate 5-triphosphate synthase subunit PhnG